MTTPPPTPGWPTDEVYQTVVGLFSGATDDHDRMEIATSIALAVFDQVCDLGDDSLSDLGLTIVGD